MFRLLTFGYDMSVEEMGDYVREKVADGERRATVFLLHGAAGTGGV